MKKILILIFIIGLFYGCSSRGEPKHQSMLEILNSYKGSGKDTIKIKGLVANEIEVNLKEFFALSKEEQAIKAEEIQREVDRETRKYFAKAGISYNKDDSEEEQSRKITDQVLDIFTSSLPSSIGKRIQNGRDEVRDKNIQKIKSLVKNGDTNGVKAMIRDGFDVNKIIDSFYKSTIIYNAIDANNLELVKFLVENGADLNIQSRHSYSTPLVYACRAKNKKIVEYLINQNIDFSKQRNLLHEILVFDDLKLIDKCLSKNMNINDKNEKGNTPLVWAIYNGNKLETIKYLIKKGADTNILSADNKNILEIAKSNNKKEIYDYLKTIYKPKKNIYTVKNSKQNEVLQKIYNQHNTLAINKIDISKDEKLFASVDQSGTVRIFNFENGQLLKKIKGNNQDIILFKFIDNDKKLAISSIYETAILDIEIGDIISKLKEQSIESEIKTDKQMEELEKMHGKNNPNLNIFKAITNMFNTQWFGIGKKPIGDKTNIDITPNGKNLIVLKSNGNINIWDIKKAEVVKVIEDKKITSFAIIDNDNIIYNDENENINALNINSEEVVTLSKNHTISKFYKRNHYIVMDMDFTSYMFLLNIKTRKSEIGFVKQGGEIRDISITDNKKIIIGTSKGKLYIGDMLSTPKKRGNISFREFKLMGFHNSDIKDLAILPKSKNLLSIGADGIKLWKI